MGGDRATGRPRMRPRFELELAVPGELVLGALRAQLAEGQAAVAATVHQRLAELRIPRGQAHFWSPCLSLTLAEGEAGSERLLGRFGPDPSVWMMFMGIYGVLTMGGTLAFMFGVSQWLAHQPPWAFWGVPASLALLAFAYGAAFIGQGLGAEEMYTLRSCVDHAVHEAAKRAGQDAARDAIVEEAARGGSKDAHEVT